MAAGPGWYPDPNDPHTTRYWNGTEYTSVRVWNGTNWVEQPPAPPPPPMTTPAAAGADAASSTPARAGTRRLVWIGAAVAVVIVLVIAGAVGGGSDGNERQSGWDSLSGRAKDLELRHLCGNRDFDVDHSPTEDDCGCVADYTESHYTLDEAKRVTRVLPAFNAPPGDVSAQRAYLRGVNDACF